MLCYLHPSKALISTPMHYCKHCGLELQTSPERSEGDWYIQCLTCGAKNVVIPVLQVIGWRI